MPNPPWLTAHSRHSAKTRNRPQLLWLNLHGVGWVEQELLLRRHSVRVSSSRQVSGHDLPPGTASHDREPPCWRACPRPSSPRTSAPRSTPLRPPPRQREGVGQFCAGASEARVRYMIGLALDSLRRPLRQTGESPLLHAQG